MLNRPAEPLEVAGLQAQPGERVEGYLPVGELPDGSPVRVPIVLVRGLRPGPVVYLQAVSDGDELNGIAVLHRLLRALSPKDLAGGLILVPLVNPSAFLARQAYNPLDRKKMNRCFPGRPDGSASERIAYTLFHEAVLRADLCIDLHQGGVRPMIDEVRVRVGGDHPLYRDCMELARVFGIGYILDERGPDGQLARAAPDAGIPTIDPELGGCYGWDAQSIAKGLRGVQNVLFHYGLIEGTPQIPDVQYVARGFRSVYTRRAGFVEWAVELYDRVAAEQRLGVLYNIFGDPIEELRAPCEGIVWSRSLYPMVAAGEVAMSLGVNVEVWKGDQSPAPSWRSHPLPRR
ncbi:MAG: deacylase [Candidatus Poribacteria bacterium]|nr:MAG: deacylase [Candidatus Poribacteria bacterium]